VVKYANNFLKSRWKENKCLHYWKLTGVKNSEINLYQDGVHFNDVGNYRYYRNLRGAIEVSIYTVVTEKRVVSLTVEQK
jgi:hypothetical protein